MRSNVRLSLHICLRVVSLLRRRFMASLIGVAVLFFLGIYWKNASHFSKSIADPLFNSNWEIRSYFKQSNGTNTAQYSGVLPKLDIHGKSEEKSRAACKLPALDPYHESVMEHIKDLGQLECGEPYGKFDNNTLTVEGDNIFSVTYRVINRPEKSDFSVSLSEPVDIPDMAAKPREREYVTDIKAGGSGCIIHMASKKCLHPYGGSAHPNPGVKVVLHEDCCKNRILFTMLANGTIKHLSSGLCLHGNAGRYGRSMVLDTDCSTSCRAVNGSLHLMAVGTTPGCLQPEHQSDTPANDESLINGTNCSATFGFNTFQGAAFKGVAQVNHDFVLVTITHGAGAGETTEVYMNAAAKPKVLRRPVKPAGIPVSVAMLMLDSTSAANFVRKMPKTLEYLKELPTVFLKGHTIVGDGTTAQLCAMLTGIDERDEPEARRRMPGAKHVDDWRWVFRDYERRGYATMYSEDSPGLGTFNYRLKGFRHPPTDHYGRYFWLEATKYGKKDFCTGNSRTHLLTMDYVMSLFRSYPKNPKFAFALFSDLVHGNPNALGYGDEDMYFLLKKMEDEYFLDSTIVIIFGDHGYRFGPLRKTLQGKLEERLPHMSITFPKWFPHKYRSLYEAIQRNSELLTTPFDMYATLQHILSYPLPPKEIKTGQSLFTLIDLHKRSCSTAGVEDHWCPCLSFEKVAVSDTTVRNLATFAVKYINALLDFDKRVKRLCSKLSLQEIKVALRDMPNEKLQKFEKSYEDHHCDSCGAMFGDKAKDTLSRDTLYQIQLVTSPNNGFFEASVKLTKGVPSIVGEISRVDSFGHQSDCIKDSYVHLIKFCYCR